MSEEQVKNEAAVAKPKAAEVVSDEAPKGSEGIQNTLELISFAVALTDAVKKAKEDGKVTLADVPLLFPLAPLLGPVINDIGHIPAELGDLSEDELAVLIAEASKALGGENNAKTILKVKAALKFALAGKDLYQAFAK